MQSSDDCDETQLTELPRAKPTAETHQKVLLGLFIRLRLKSKTFSDSFHAARPSPPLPV